MASCSVRHVALCLLFLASVQGNPQRHQEHQMNGNHQMNHRQHQNVFGPHQMQQRRQQNQRFRVLPPHEQPKFDDDDGGDHRPATVSDHYCRISSHHSLCRQPHTREACGYVRRRTLNYDEAAMLLHRHNMERMRLAQGLIRGRNGVLLPQGADIMQMTYDIELHDIAQGAADRCHGRHDCHQCRKSDRFRVGQNVAGKGTQLDRRQFSREELQKITFRPIEQMGGWLGEVRELSPKDIDRFPGIAGHYTQLVWSSSYLLGCGYIEREIHNGMEARVYCNYGPAGNLVNDPVYRAGMPCSACPRGSRCSLEYPGLCKREN